MRYPFADLQAADRDILPELQDAACRVIASGRYVGGAECEAFEHELAAMHGPGLYAVGVSNGLDALRLILAAYIADGVLAPGDEVIVPANTYIATVLAITDNGLTPVLVEPTADTLNVDTSLIEQAVTPRTRAIMTVHLYGRAAWDNVMAGVARRHGLLVIEDNAQAIGAHAEAPGLNGTTITGALGDAAAFSFYPTKNAGAVGDAGAVLTRDARLAATVRALANYGSDRRYHNIYCGYNCRLDPIQAAILRVRLRHLGDVTARRRALAAIYDQSIDNPLITLPGATPGHVYHQYVILADDRYALRDYLTSQGVGTDIHYAVPPHLQPCYAAGVAPAASTDVPPARAQGQTDVLPSRGRFTYPLRHGPLPVTEQIAARCLSIPITPCTTPSDARAIAAILTAYRP